MMNPRHALVVDLLLIDVSSAQLPLISSGKINCECLAGCRLDLEQLGRFGLNIDAMVLAGNLCAVLNFGDIIIELSCERILFSVLEALPGVASRSRWI
jgi:hypothetical protein